MRSNRVDLLAVIPVAISLGFAGCKVRDGRSAAANPLLQAFGASCVSTVGPWTRAALNQTESLKASIELLSQSEKEACKAAGAALSSVRNIHDQLARLESDKSSATVIGKQTYRDNLLLTLSQVQSSGGDPAFVAALQQAYYSSEIDLIAAKASVQGSNSSSYVDGLSSLTSFSRSLLESQQQLATCYAAAPYMAFQMASAMLSIGGNFTTPVLGAAFSVIGDLVTSSIEAFRTSKFRRAMLDADVSNMRTALLCALESMSNLYCQAENSRQFLGLAKDSQNNPDFWEPTEIWKGMNLIGRKLGIVNRWLLQVRGGVDPSDPAAAEYINSIWNKIFQVQKIRTSLQGMINKAARDIDGTLKDDQRTLILRRVMRDTISQMYFGGSNNIFSSSSGPFAEYVSVFVAICRISGDPKCEVPTSGLGTDWSSLIDKYQIIGGLTGKTALEGRLFEFVDEIEGLAFGELRREIGLNPDVLIARATRPVIENRVPGQASVVGVLRELATYLRESADYFDLKKPDDAYMVHSELARSISTWLTGAADKIVDSKLDYKERLKFVFDAFNLKNGVQVFIDKVTNPIRWDVEGRIRMGDFPSDIVKDLIAAGTSVLDRLDESGVNMDEVRKIENDIDGGKTSAQHNLQVFIDFFGRSIGKAARSFDQDARKAGEKENGGEGSNRAQLARLCILTLTTTNDGWPAHFDLELCRGAVLESVYPKSGLRLTFNKLAKKLAGKPLEQRMCTYYDFRRAEAIYGSGFRPRKK